MASSSSQIDSFAEKLLDDSLGEYYFFATYIFNLFF